MTKSRCGDCGEPGANAKDGLCEPCGDFFRLGAALAPTPAEETLTELEQWLKELVEACEFMEKRQYLPPALNPKINPEGWGSAEWGASRRSYEDVLDRLETKRSGNG